MVKQIIWSRLAHLVNHTFTTVRPGKNFENNLTICI